MGTLDPLAMLRASRNNQEGEVNDPLLMLRQSRAATMEPVEDERNDLLQTGAGVLEGILDPLSVIPFVDKRLQRLEEYRGSSVGGKIGYGIGAVGGLFIPLAPANLTLRAGTAAARGLKLVKSIEKSEDIALLADRMVELSLAGELVQGAVSGGLMAGGMPVEDGESRAVQAFQGAALGGIADVMITPAWRAISGVWKASKTVPPELAKIAEDILTTGAADNAPVIADDKIAALLGRALTLADNVLGEGSSLEAKTEMSLNLARSLRAMEVGELQVIPKVARNQRELVKALEEQGLEVVEASKEGVSSFLVGMPGTLKGLAEEFSYNGFVTGQGALVPKLGRGTILGKGEKAGTVKVLLPGKKIKEVSAEELPLQESHY